MLIESAKSKLVTGLQIEDSPEAGGGNLLMEPAETPELNATTERKFRTLGERTLCMMLRSGLPVDFWWDAYEASNYITNRLPTKTSCMWISNAL